MNKQANALAAVQAVMSVQVQGAQADVVLPRGARSVEQISGGAPPYFHDPPSRDSSSSRLSSRAIHAPRVGVAL